MQKLLPDRTDAQAAMRAAYQYKDSPWGLSTWPHVVDCFNLGEYSNAIIFAWFICEQALKAHTTGTETQNHGR